MDYCRVARQKATLNSIEYELSILYYYCLPTVRANLIRVRKYRTMHTRVQFGRNRLHVDYTYNNNTVRAVSHRYKVQQVGARCTAGNYQDYFSFEQNAPKCKVCTSVYDDVA